MRANRLYISVGVATVAFALTFLAHPFVKPPQLWYYPVEHKWTFAAHASGIVIGWYGRTLAAMALGSFVAFGAWSFARDGAPWMVRLTTWAVITSVTLAVVSIVLLDLDVVR